MGSWEETCSISNLPIKCGDEIYIILLTQTPYVSEHIAKSGCYPTDHWFPRSIPVLGKYDDYGRIAIDKGEEFLAETILDQFRYDLVEAGESSVYLKDAVSRKDLTWDKLDDWLHSGRVWVDKTLLDKASSTRNPEYLESLRKSELERSQAEQDNLRKHREEWAFNDAARQAMVEALFPGAHPNSSPVVRTYVRKDVYDYIQKSEQVYAGKYDTTMSSAEFSEQARDYIDFFISDRRKNNRIKDDSAVKLRKALNSLKYAAARQDGNQFANCIFHGMNLFPPFAVTPKWTLEQLGNQYPKYSAKKLKAVAVRIAELIVLNSAFTTTRMSWGPTSGTGSQGIEFMRTAEMHQAFAAIGFSQELHSIAVYWGDSMGSSLLGTDESDWDRKSREKGTATLKVIAQARGVPCSVVLTEVLDILHRLDSDCVTAEIREQVMQRTALV